MIVRVFMVLVLAASLGFTQDRERMMAISFQLQELFDEDRNARASIEELSIPKQMAERLDGNGDGFVDFEEFESMTLRGTRAALPSDRSDFTHIEEEGFPLNVNPEILPAAEASELVSDDDMVMGIILNGEARAYPVNYMNGPYNEVVNDNLGGEAIAPSW